MKNIKRTLFLALIGPRINGTSTSGRGTHGYVWWRNT